MGICCSKDSSSQSIHSASYTATAKGGPITHQSASKSITADECKRLLEMPASEAREQRQSFKRLVDFKNYQSFKEIERIQDVYMMGKELGKGSFGSVNLAKHKAFDLGCAIKTIKKSGLTNKVYRELMANELRILGETEHPSIVRVYQLLQDSQNYYVSMELMNGGDLLGRILKKKSFNETDAACIIEQVLQAINYMHKANITHRDMKLENLLCQNDDSLNVKITDFGFACHFDPNQDMNLSLGSPLYMAPEIVDHKPYNNSVDIWSIGVITYIILSGKPPFSGPSKDDIFNSIRYNEPYFGGSTWGNLSDDAKNFVLQCLTKDGSKRPSAEELLESSWIKNKPRVEIDQQVQLDVIAQLSEFRKMNAFQSAMISFLVNLKATSQELDEISKVFKEIDSDNNGFLSEDEIREGINRMIGTSSTNFEEILRAADSNKDGKVSYNEFIAAAADKAALLHKDTLDKAFIMFDADGNGFITIDELKAVFANGSSSSQSNVNWLDFIKAADKDGDQQISKDEFIDVMMEAAKNAE